VAKKGVFICIEGLDGCGKTTQAKLLVARLRQQYDAVYTAEPSDGKIGSFIRRSYLYSERRISHVAEALLFAADRVDHLEREVLPALRKGQVVVSDRYVYSSMAYQGAAGLDLGWIKKINEYAIRPDLAFFIDVTPEVVMQRLRRRRTVMENLSTQQRVREVYLKFVNEGILVRIDGEQTKEAVANALLAVVLTFLEANR
jgi:dTMP kinase